MASVDANYFDSYSSFNIHREMISDKVRSNETSCIRRYHSTFTQHLASSEGAQCLLQEELIDNTVSAAKAPSSSLAMYCM